MPLAIASFAFFTYILGAHAMRFDSSLVKQESTGTWPPSPKDIWALLSIDGINSECLACGDNNDADLSLVIDLYPSGVKYEIPASVQASKLEMHVYVPRTDIFADVTLYSGNQNSVLGTLSVSMFNDHVQFPVDAALHDQGWCDIVTSDAEGCSFARALANQVDNVFDSPGSLNGKLYTGDAMEKTAIALNHRGYKVMYTDRHDRAVDYVLHRIPVENVEHHLNYAKKGSAIPEGLRGLVWMDQRGMHLKDVDTDFKQVCESASDEILVSWGEAGWDPETRCVMGQDIYGGGPLWGHWTWFDQTGGGSDHWNGAGIHKPIARFCFSEDYKTIDIYRSFMAANLPGLNVLKGVDFSMDFPSSVLHLKMNEMPWGWDRETEVAGGSMVCHYPVWQIVDENGQRTEHYDAYVKWATNQSSCPDGKATFGCHQNVATDGTQLIARATPDLCARAVVGAVKRDGEYDNGETCKCKRNQELSGDAQECSGRKFDPSKLFDKGCRCSIEKVATAQTVAQICAHAVPGSVESGDAEKACACPSRSSVEPAYSWSNTETCNGVGGKFSPEGFAGKGCHCGDPVRCCCKSSDSSTCRLFSGTELRSSWSFSTWGQPSCPSKTGYRHFRRFGIEHEPSTCAH